MPNSTIEVANRLKVRVNAIAKVKSDHKTSKNAFTFELLFQITSPSSSNHTTQRFPSLNSMSVMQMD